MKVAVIGSGAAALGVLDRLSTLEPVPDITLVGRSEFIAASPVNLWTRQRLHAFYKEISFEPGVQFPPPKTNFDLVPKMQNVEDWGRIWDSCGYGGLTNFWGLSATPFSNADFEGWPYGRTELDTHYAAIAKRIGITGQRDALNDWIGDDFVNRPPIQRTPLATALAGKINSQLPTKAYRFVAGASRLAVETRSAESNCCTYCGECMIGCPQRSMYSTVRDLDLWRRAGLISRVISGRVLCVDRETVSVIIETSGGSREMLGSFDRIYICAGCVGTTEIVMRTLDMRDGLRIVDNSVYTFPIVYTGPGVFHGYDQQCYFGLSNLLISALSLTPGRRNAQLQIYVIFDHLWRYYTPSVLWSPLAALGRALRRRVLLARLYLHGDHSQHYSIRVDGNQPARLSLAHAGTPLLEVPDLWLETRRVLSGDDFMVPPIKPVRQKTSAHYAASLPLGIGPVAINGSISSGIFLCDSSTFPTAPATSPTFTIMANARRIADISVQ
jgi:ferredoxin